MNHLAWKCLNSECPTLRALVYIFVVIQYQIFGFNVRLCINILRFRFMPWFGCSKYILCWESSRNQFPASASSFLLFIDSKLEIGLAEKRGRIIDISFQHDIRIRAIILSNVEHDI